MERGYDRRLNLMNASSTSMEKLGTDILRIAKQDISNPATTRIIKD